MFRFFISNTSGFDKFDVLFIFCMGKKKYSFKAGDDTKETEKHVNEKKTRGAYDMGVSSRIISYVEETKGGTQVRMISPRYEDRG